MSTRWCILGAPRSGSNFLEEIIYDNISVGAGSGTPAVRVAEFFHLRTLYYYDSNGKEFVHQMENTFLDPQGSDFRNRINDLVANSSRPMVMRIFPYIWHKNYVDIGSYLSFLKNYGFQLLYLQRPLISRVISLSVAKSSNIWHKYEVDGNVFYNTTDGNKSDVNVVKVTLELQALAENFLDSKLNDWCLNKLMAAHPGTIINYQTIETDLRQVGIKILKRTNIQKLYNDVDYSGMIANYQEAIQLLNWLSHG